MKNFGELVVSNLAMVEEKSAAKRLVISVDAETANALVKAIKGNCTELADVSDALVKGSVKEALNQSVIGIMAKLTQ